MTNYITSVGVQKFSITIAVGSTTGTATISAVGSGAFILLGGVSCSINANTSEDFAGLTLTNSTTITATRNIGLGGTVTINGCIVDGDTTNLIKSIQYGTVTIANSASSGTSAISAVTNSNTAIHLLGFQSASAGLMPQSIYPIVSLSGTTVTASVASTVSPALTAYFVVIEFQGTALNQSTQNVSAASSSSVTSYTASITSVVTNNSIVIPAGNICADTSTSCAKSKLYGQLTNSTTLTVNVNTAIAAAKTYDCTVIEFVSGVLNSAVQRGTTALTAVTSNTSSITGVTLGNSAISFLGNIYSAANTNTKNSEGQVVLTNGTTVTSSRNAATGNITTSWEVFEFSPPAASVTVSPTGVSATGAVGTVVPQESVAPTGISATGGIGSVIAGIAPVLTGVSCTGAVGTPTVQYGSTVSPSGVSATGAVGIITPQVAGTVTGIAATGQVGSVTLAEAIAILGIAGTGAVGAVIPQETINLSGVSGTGQVGTATATGTGSPNATANPFGVSATGQVGIVTVTIPMPANRPEWLIRFRRRGYR